MKKLKFFSGLLACTLISSLFCISSKAEEIKPEKPRDTELVFVVDKSGSMYNLTDETIGSFNSVIEKQKEPSKEGSVYVTTVMFNQKSEKIHDRKNIKDIEPITKKEYTPRGCTALLDATGNTITELSQNEEVSKNKVVFVIITDGYENASTEFKKDTVKKLIENQTKKGWDFIFLGANIDSVNEGSSIGITPHLSKNFSATAEGVREVYNRINYAIDCVRTNTAINLDETPKDNKVKTN